jgi:hypothetical protein
VSKTKEWIKKMWYIYTMEYHAVIKNNETMSFAGKWMDGTGDHCAELERPSSKAHLGSLDLSDEKLFKAHCMHGWNFCSDTPCAIKVC